VGGVGQWFRNDAGGQKRESGVDDATKLPPSKIAVCERWSRVCFFESHSNTSPITQSGICYTFTVIQGCCNADFRAGSRLVMLASRGWGHWVGVIGTFYWGVIGDLMQVLAQSTCYSSSTFFKAEALWFLDKFARLRLSGLGSSTSRPKHHASARRM